MEVVTLRMEENLHEHLRLEAQRRSISEAELARLFIARGLGIARANDEQATLEGILRKVLRDELRPTRHYAWLAAREAAASHRYGKGAVGILVNHLVRLPSDQRQAVLDQSEAAAQRFATQRLQNDKEQDDLALDAPATPLPGPEEEVTVEDEDTASMIEGA